MKLINICCLWFVVCCFSFAQNKHETKEEKLQKLRSRSDIKITEIEKDILKLEYPNGKVLNKNVGDYKYPESDFKVSPTFDSTIIDLTNIDTTLYYHKYKFWQEVPIHNWDFDYIRVGDVNNNGKPELYGARKFFQTDYEPVTVYELNDLGIFEPVYQYDSVYLIRNIYDVDRDGKDEVHLTLPPIFGTGNQQRFFSKEYNTSLATQFSLSYMYGTGSQLDDQTLGDFDADGFTDLLFDISGSPYFYILEYNPLINNFDSVYRFDVNEPPPNDEGGYSIGDFDLDGKTDIVFSTGRGNVHVIENQGNNQYINTWQGNIGRNNAYVHTWTNDIDKNGKPEFWVLADTYYNGIGTTRITMFETDGDDNYKAVGRIDLLGVFSFYAGSMQSIDIDSDGIEEVAVCIDGNFLILKFNGSINHHSYSIHYIKQNELNNEEEWQTYFGATMADLENNGEMAILISMIHIIDKPIRIAEFATRIYLPDSTTIVNDNIFIPAQMKLYQNYPNPFNPKTNIKFKLNKTETVLLKVYDILGKEIKLLFNKDLPSGEYDIQWDGKDNKGNLLPGGVYFIQMIAGENQQTIKSILLK